MCLLFRLTGHFAILGNDFFVAARRKHDQCVMEGLFYGSGPETFIIPCHGSELRKGEDSKARLNLPPVDPISPCRDRAKREGLGF